MELGQQWCDNAACPDYGKVGAGNIKAFRYVEQRDSCATCRHTFSADKHPFFETLRCPRSTCQGTDGVAGAGLREVV